ncbi:DUF1573 domain-containing protein [Candidatus Margulisiibacteriota bacterium]
MRIKYFVILIAIIILVLAGKLLFYERDTTPRPRIQISPMAWDLGRVTEGEKPENFFKICNLGKAVLDIKSARPSCSCDTVTLTTDEVAPHGCAIMKVVFDSQDRAGTVEAWIYVESNDPEQPLVQIKIFAEVTPKR